MGCVENRIKVLVKKSLLPSVLLVVMLLAACASQPSYTNLREDYIPHCDLILIVHGGDEPKQEFVEARQLLAQAKALEGYYKFEAVKNNSTDVLERAHCYNGMGAAMALMSRYREAMELFEKAKELYTQAEGEESAGVGAVYQNIGVLYNNQMDKGKIAEYGERAVAILGKQLPENHPDIGAAHLVLCYPLIDEVRGTEFSFHLNWAKIIMKNAFEEDNILTLQVDNMDQTQLRSEVNSSKVYQNIFESRDFYNKYLTVIKEQYGENHPRVADMYYNIASTYTQTLENLTQAKEYIDKAEKIYVDCYGENQYMLYTIHSNWAFAMRNTNMWEEAIDAYSKAIDISWKIDIQGMKGILYGGNMISLGTIIINRDQTLDSINYLVKGYYICVNNSVADAEIMKSYKEDTIKKAYNMFKTDDVDFETWFAEQLAIVKAEFEAEYEASEKELEAARIYKGD